MGMPPVVGSVFDQRRTKVRSFFPIHGSLGAAPAITASVCDDQRVDRKALHARHLHRNARPAERRCVDRYCDQKVQVVRRLSADAKAGNVLVGVCAVITGSVPPLATPIGDCMQAKAQAVSAPWGHASSRR